MKKLICFAVILAAMFTLMGCGGGSSSSDGSSDDPIYETLSLAKDINEQFMIVTTITTQQDPDNPGPEICGATHREIKIKILPTDNSDYIAIAENKNDYLTCGFIQNKNTKDIYMAEGSINNGTFEINKIGLKFCPKTLKPNTFISENDEYKITLGEKGNKTVNDKTYSAYAIQMEGSEKIITYIFIPELCYYVSEHTVRLNR